MKRLHVGMAVLALAVSAGLARADEEPRITWAHGFPAAGPAKGEVVVRGTFPRLPGWVAAGSVKLQAWPEGGGVAISASIASDPESATWAGSIRGLPSGQTYNVMVLVPVCDGTNRAATYALLGKVQVR